MDAGLDGHEPVGLLLVDKPTGMTSHDVVAWARRGLATRRVGHAGTLDPLASVLLPLLVGRATRLVSYLHGWPKTYVGVVQLGLEAETGDLEGADLSSFVPPPLPPAAVLEAARRRLTGPHLQTPPAYSAKKIRGTPAHAIARRGALPVLASVPVTVHALRLRPVDGGRVQFAARVSSGTYLRSLARDIGRLCGTGGCIAALRRTAVGPLRVRGVTRAAIARPERGALRPLLLPPESAPLPLPTITLDAPGCERFRGGRPVEVPDLAAAGALRVLGPDGLLEGIGTADPEAGVVRPRVVLRAGSGSV